MWIFDSLKGAATDAGFIKNQMRSVIQWDNPAPDILAYRYTDRWDEIKNASKLIVAPGQGVVIVYQWKVQDIQTEPGTYDMATDNIPFITTISKIMQAFESEHKVGIYFFKTTIIADQKWGTKSPVKYIDPVYKFPVGMRAFGNFSFRISDFSHLFISYLGTQDAVTIDSLRTVVTDRIIAPLTDAFATAGMGYNQIDANRMELSELVKTAAKDDFAPFGLELSDFRIENTDFDEDTQTRIKGIADTQAQVIASQSAGVSYADMQKLRALRDAAKNEWGAAGMFVGMGAGQMLGGVMNTSTPETPEARLAKIKSLFDSGLISEEEFAMKKTEILSSI
jgi:membrane protease subunit (stomatin/prohibitin family)